MNKKFHFLNHTSLLLQHDGHYLLLDPWPSEFLSFNSWKSHPPCFLDNNILASFINSSDNKLGIVISHGHDDHCDNNFLKKVNSSTPVFFPKYKSKGLSKRLEQNNLDNISELSSLQNISFGPFKLSVNSLIKLIPEFGSQSLPSVKACIITFIFLLTRIFESSRICVSLECTPPSLTKPKR